MNAGFKFMRIAMNSLETYVYLANHHERYLFQAKSKSRFEILVDIMIYFMPTAYFILV